MFILRQRNLILNINKFTKNFNNFKDVKINNNDNTSKKDAKFKVIKLKLFNDNRLQLKN